MPFSLLIRNQRGIALLYLIIFFTLLGVLVSAGVRKFNSIVTLAKAKDTRTELERDVQMITAWAVRNGYWPTFKDYSSGIFGSKPLDTWGRPLVYAYYSSPTRSSTSELCGRATSDITYNGQYVAFLLLSGGDDMTITSTPAASGAFSGALTSLAAEDMYRIVTLSELQSQAGCNGTTTGSLRILNNELPTVCYGGSYNAAVFATGGVPAGGATYKWTIPVTAVSPLPSGYPAWLTVTAHSITLSPSLSTSPVYRDSTGLLLAGTAPYAYIPYSMMLAVKDNDSTPNIMQRAYTINVSITGACSTACAADPACSAACAADPACRAACSADSACATTCPACIL
ncbi:MAG: hypothetical protein WCP20_21370 [Desulfuromonadales bacterium]